MSRALDASRRSVPSRAGIGFTGTRFYLFEGGCVTYEFRFSRDERAKPIGEANLALSFVTRDELSRRVLEETDGRYELDP